MDEEVDYMSDEFLQSCLQNAKDVRPGLLHSHNQKREHNLLKKKTELENNKPNPIEILKESLQQPIKETNKGFSMLEKMGFKSGMGLGKDNSGIKEPIGIKIKNDKIGLGHKPPPSESRKVESKINEKQFRSFLSNKHKQRETCSDLRKSQRLCRELDLECDVSEPKELWFWPKEKESESDEEKEEDDDDVEELSDLEKLEILTKYLREKYFYCIWCKVKYEDEKDMEECPGWTRDDH